MYCLKLTQFEMFAMGKHCWVTKIGMRICIVVFQFCLSCINRFTGKYVSPILCNRELQGVQCQPTAFDNMTVKARPMTWEVIATYAVEELSMDLVIQLATNHPLGVITVDSGKKVGVSQSQWRNWMLQLTTFLTHQVGYRKYENI